MQAEFLSLRNLWHHEIHLTGSHYHSVLYELLMDNALVVFHCNSLDHGLQRFLSEYAKE